VGAPAFPPTLLHLAPDGRVLSEIKWRRDIYPVLASDKWLYCVEVSKDGEVNRLVQIPTR
jgi:hypothetical protein